MGLGVGDGTIAIVIRAKDEASRVINGVDRSTGKLGKTMGGAKVAATAALGGILAVGTASVKKWEEYGGAVSKLTKLSDVSTESASKLVGQWQRYGVSAEGGAKGVIMLSKQIAAAKDGNATAIESFKRVGVSVEDLKTLGSADIMAKARDGLSAMGPSADRTALMLKLLGKGGVEMLSWVNAAPGDIENLNGKLKDLGMVWGDKQLTDYKDLAKAQKEMSLEWTAFQLKVAQSVVPALMDLAGVFMAVFDAMQPLAPVLKYVAAGLLAFLVVGKIYAIMQPLLAAMKSWAILSKLVAAGQWLLNAALSANPVGIIILAIVALVAAFVILWKKCDWFRNFWLGLWEQVKGIFAAVWPVLRAVAQAIVAGLRAAWKAIRTAVLAFWRWAGPFIKKAVKVWWQAIKTDMALILAVVKLAWKLISAAVRQAVANVKATVQTIKTLVAFVRDVFNKIHSAVVTIGRTISGAASAIWHGIKSTAQTVWGAIVGVVRTAWNNIAGFVNKIIGAINWVIDKVPGMGSVGSVPTLPTSSSSSTRGNGGAGSPSSDTSPSPTPTKTVAAKQDNEGMGGLTDAVGGAIGSATSWIGDLLDKVHVPWPKPGDGFVGGAEAAVLELAKDAVWNLVKKFGGGDGMEIVNFAKSMLGMPYVWGGSSPAAGGFDCSGLIYWAYQQAGKSMPRVPTYGGRQISQSAIRPADVLFYYPGAIQNGERVPFGHFKMYAGNGQTIESTTGGVQMRPADFAGAAQIRTYLRLGGITNGPAIAGEGGPYHPEAVIPLTNARRGAAVLKAAGLAGGGGTYNLTVPVYVDSELVAEHVITIQGGQARRYQRTFATGSA